MLKYYLRNNVYYTICEVYTTIYNILKSDPDLVDTYFKIIYTGSNALNFYGLLNTNERKIKDHDVLIYSSSSDDLGKILKALEKWNKSFPTTKMRVNTYSSNTHVYQVALDVNCDIKMDIFLTLNDSRSVEFPNLLCDDYPIQMSTVEHIFKSKFNFDSNKAFADIMLMFKYLWLTPYEEKFNPNNNPPTPF